MVRSTWFGLAALVMISGQAAFGQETTETKTTETTTTEVKTVEPKSTTERIKEKAGSAVGTVKKGVTSAGDAIKNKYNQAKDHIAAMGIEARVYSRLHWDKALAASKIELTAPKAGVIVLTGNLSDPKARDKAVALAAETIGVTDVVDHLTITTPAEADAVK